MAEQYGLMLDNRDEALRRAETLPSKSSRSRATNRIDNYHKLLSALPEPEDLTFNHSGLCQTSLPHMRPVSNSAIWKRQSGRFTLMIRPGVMSTTEPVQTRGRAAAGHEDYVGVPYGSKARLIMFHLQTEGRKSRTVSLGKNLSTFLRSLNLDVRGGDRGTIKPIREQALRIARCTFTMQWAAENGEHTVITDTNIVEGMELWQANSDEWSAEVQLTSRFHEHLCEHAVPLDKRSIALLSQNSLGLDLYALFAYRLPKLSKTINLSWEQLHDQMGSEGSASELSRRVRLILPEVLRAYQGAKVEVRQQQGKRPGLLILHPSPPAVPRTAVPGFTLISNPDKAS